MSYGQARIEELRPDDVVLVDLPVDAEVLSVEINPEPNPDTVRGNHTITVRHRVTNVTHVIYTSAPTMWKKIDDGHGWCEAEHHTGDVGDTAQRIHPEQDDCINWKKAGT